MALLPEDLIMQILLKIPYPFILNARLLSKKCSSLFSCESQSPCAKTIQSQLARILFNSVSRALLQLGGNRLRAYDISSRTRSEMMIPLKPAICGLFLDETDEYHVSIAGLMICVFTNGQGKNERIVIVNLVTGSFKLLHAPAKDAISEYQNLLHCKIFHVVQGGFIIVLLSERVARTGTSELVVQLYDSRKGWSVDYIDVTHLRPVYRTLVCKTLCEDQKLFLLFNYVSPSVMVKYDVCGKVWKESVIVGDHFRLGRNRHLKGLVSYGTRVFIVSLDQVLRNARTHWLHLMEFVKTPGFLVQVPQEHSVGRKDYLCSIEHISSNENHIYIILSEKLSAHWKIHCFNVETSTWNTELVPKEKQFRWVANSPSASLDTLYDLSSLPD